MNNSNNMNNDNNININNDNKLNGHDLMNIGIFGAIYFVILFFVAMLGMIPIFYHFSRYLFQL